MHFSPIYTRKKRKILKNPVKKADFLYLFFSSRRTRASSGVTFSVRQVV